MSSGHLFFAYFLNEVFVFVMINVRSIDNMRKHDVIKRIKFFASIVSVFILGVFVYKTSYALLTNSIIDKIGFDEETSKYITFNYWLMRRRLLK